MTASASTRPDGIVGDDLLFVFQRLVVQEEALDLATQVTR